jgi:hypothetical protein
MRLCLPVDGGDAFALVVLEACPLDSVGLLELRQLAQGRVDFGEEFGAAPPCVDLGQHPRDQRSGLHVGDPARGKRDLLGVQFLDLRERVHQALEERRHAIAEIPARPGVRAAVESACVNGRLGGPGRGWRVRFLCHRRAEGMQET